MFDVPTLATMATVIGIEAFIGFALLAYRLRKLPGMLDWVRGAGVTILGAVFLVVSMPYAEITIAFVGVPLMVLGGAIAWQGARAYCGLPRHTWFLWVSLGAITPWSIWFGYVAPNLWLRVIGFSLVTLFTTWGVFWTLWRHTPAQQRVSARVVGGVFLFTGAFNVIRMLFPHEGLATSDLLSPGLLHALNPLQAIVACLASAVTITALYVHRLAADLRRIARHDALTGVLNREAFEQSARAAVRACRDAHRPCALLIMDLDHFKQVNDTFGHAAGDEALRRFASVCEDSRRESDLFGRYGGEEFCLLMPGARAEDAAPVAERLRQLLNATAIVVDGQVLSVAVSIGIAAAEGDRLRLSTMLREADRALYQAKEDGRDRVVVAAMPLKG